MKIDIVTENQMIKNKIQNLIDEFFDIEKLKIINDKQIEIIVSKNYNSDFFKYSNNLAINYYKEKGIPENKALTILPNDINYSKFIIVVKENVFDDKEYFSTIIHELTHVIDFINHFNNLGNVYYGNAVYDEFYFWTEFNAKRAGLERLQKELNKTGLIISLKSSAEIFILENNKMISANEKVYNLVHFLARISIYDEMKNLAFDEQEFPRQFIISVFGSKTFKLYDLLNIAYNYEKFKVLKESIRETIDDLIIYN